MIQSSEVMAMQNGGLKIGNVYRHIESAQGGFVTISYNQSSFSCGPKFNKKFKGLFHTGSL